jgi:hypothetical protein
MLTPCALMDVKLMMLPFSVWTEFTVPIGKRGEHPRGKPLVTRTAALQAEQRRETQWHP